MTRKPGVDGNPRIEVQDFADRIEKKLQMNDHKPHWSEHSDMYLLGRMRQEHVELIEAIFERKSGEEIADEAADVAAFAMFIADNATKGVGDG